jgi:predicted aldo/keto reductase-like oxidoreductase
MQYRVLGKTGLEVSVIGFGGIPVQRTSYEEARDSILKAEALGINFIDTAKGYTVSEEYIGKALEGSRDQWILSTKSMARDRESMTRDIESSFVNLKTDYIDVYHVHNVRNLDEYEKVMSEDGAYSAISDYVAKGKIGHIGFTTHNKDMLAMAIESGKFETIMFPYNIVEHQAGGAFKRAKELNIGVIAMKPLAGGVITDAALALRYIIENGDVTCAIPGMANLQEVIDNAWAAENFQPLSDAEREDTQKIAQALGTQFCRRCGYCGPCPVGIDIPTMFLLKGYKERYGLEKWSIDRYFGLKARAKDCIECGQCEERCPYDLPIRSMLKEVRQCFDE